MEKSIYTREYESFLRLLRETRQKAECTQVELAELLGQTQSYISKVERGELRLDIIQLRSICKALDTEFPKFIRKLESELS